jgi:hypothetical protein
MLTSDAISLVSIPWLSFTHWLIWSLPITHITVNGNPECTSFKTLVYPPLNSFITLSSDSYSYNIFNNQSFIHFTSFQTPWPQKLNHRSFLFFSAAHQQSNYVKHVTVLPLFRRQQKPTTCRWGKVHTVIFSMLPTSLLKSTKIYFIFYFHIYNIKKLRGFGPLANYADRATAASWRSSTNFCG